MRPDRFGRRPNAEGRPIRARRDDDLMPVGAGPTDQQLDGLAAELTSAGAAARVTPSVPDFAADLRARLLATYEAQAVLSSGFVTPLARPAAVPVSERTRPERVAPTVARRSPTVLPAPRWTAMGIAAALVLSVIGFSANQLLPTPPHASAAFAAATALVREGLRTPLATGTELRSGDEIRVDDHGRATIAIGGSEARMAGGAELRIGLVSADQIILVQLDGRVFHRVVADPDTAYTVETASLDWTAHGTAFDLDREVDGSSEVVTLTAVQHAVQLSGTNLRATVDEGRRAVVRLGGNDEDVDIGDVPATALEIPGSSRTPGSTWRSEIRSGS